MTSLLQLRRRTDRAIKNVVENYSRKTDGEEGSRIYLTEADVVFNMYASIGRVLPDGFEIHAGLRPFQLRSGKKLVWSKEKRKWNWEQAPKRNDDTSDDQRWGATVDLCVLDSSTKYWEHAKERGHRDGRGNLKYWRFISYPVEALRIGIEAKVRIRDRVSKGIFKDLKKLETIMMATRPGRFLGYLVIVDSCARDEDLVRIRRVSGKAGEVRIVMSD